MEEESHEHRAHKKHHSPVHTPNENNKKYRFEISKVRLWQGISLILLLMVAFLWFNPDFGVPKGQVPVPTGAAPSPTQAPQPQAPTKLDNVDEDDDPVMGNKNAPVTIVSFEDYQCPFCKKAFEQSVLQVKKEYIDTGKVRYIFRDFPLSFHPEAQSAAEASECADEQEKFWEYHDALYENQQGLGSDLYIQLAQQLGLDADKFKTCIDTGKYSQEVKDDFSYGSQIGVSGTPTFFINGIKLVGAQPYQSFKQIIDAELGE
jgi:protein-disulfide isomerase|tara:strand:- start:791 stop:1573 length:783 start_codon:yes stop_codon:yes gene_type:complete